MDKHNAASILVVDDTPENLQMLIGLLQEQGYKVRAAPNGTRALAAVQKKPPDLILLDIRMPGMDGYEVCRRLKADEHSCDIPVLFISALNDVSDKVRGFETGALDYINKPFQAEEVLARVKNHLKLRYVLQDLEVKNARLEKANIQLKMKNAELKNFAHIVSHDLKAPLRGFSRLLNWLVEDYAETLDENGRKMIGMLLSKVRQMETLISGILQYSRAGHIDGRQERIDLNLLVEKVLDLLDPPEHIRVSIEDELPHISCEQTSIQQIFQNLLSNAIEYMDKGEGEIHIRAAQNEEGWTFSIADNGPGIAEQYHEKIFNIFQSVNSDTQEEHSGIGLATVKKIVEAYGGNIWLESRPGSGSKFLFTIPEPQ